MTNFIAGLDNLHNHLQRKVLVMLSLLLAMTCAGLVIWDPQSFADRIGGFNIANGLTLIWATCSGLIHGMGFKPRFWVWQVLFFPPVAWLVMVSTLVA